MEEKTAKKVMLSGIQPSGDLTLGSYLGAIKNWSERAEIFDCYYFMADLHSITVRQNPADLRRRTIEQLAQYIACGLDPEKNTLFIQSHVPAHTQLGWVLNCYSMFGELSRMTQFKDKAAKQGSENTSAGLYAYPMLMAADILLYQTDQVPVGEDQRQHLELTRNLAQRFNARFGETFVVPEAKILGDTAKIYDLQDPNAKMSKSVPSGVIELLEDPKRSAKKIRSAVTDTGREIVYDPENKPGVSNLLAIYSSLTGRTVEELQSAYEGKGYGDLKKDLGEVVVEFATPLQEKVRGYLDDPAELDKILRRGAEHAREVATRTLRTVFDRVGFLSPAG